MPKIFVSYRRGGVRARTYRLADELKRRFGSDNIFLDIESIEPGAQFADVIRESIQASSVVLIMIGPKWATMTQGDGVRRLENESDHLRIEVETALKSNAIVIPVLVDGATMPSRSELPKSIAALADLHAYALADTHWAYDVERLINHIHPEADIPPDEKLNTQAVVSLGLLGLVLLGLADGENDNDVWLGAAAFSVTALALSIYAFVKMKPKSKKNRVLCIGGIILAAFFTIGALGNYEPLMG